MNKLYILSEYSNKSFLIINRVGPPFVKEWWYLMTFVVQGWQYLVASGWL